MAPFSSIPFVALLGGACIVAAHINVPTLTVDRQQRRAETTEIPTYHLRPVETYLVTTSAPDPQPTGDNLEIYPTGIYNDFPGGGITLNFGPDLKKKIKDAIGNDCKQDRNACRDRLVPVLHNTDVSAHTKRFVLVSALMLGYLIALVAAEVMILAAEGAYLANDVPPVKLNDYELYKIGQMDGSKKIVLEPPTNDEEATITIPSAVIATPTSTGPDFITIETLTADSGERKKGDYVYHIPLDNARRIQTAFGQFRLYEVIKVCKGYDVFNPKNSRIRRADNTIEECLRQMANFVPHFMDFIPENAVQLAQQNFPPQPGPGQPVGFPVQNMRVGGVLIVAIPYHILLNNANRWQEGPGNGPPAQRFHVPTLVRSAVGLTLVMHGVMNAGKMAFEIWVPKSSVAPETKEDEFDCPEEILCIDDDCGAQEDDKYIQRHETFCKNGKNEGCRCRAVIYPDHTMVPGGYMQGQYEWLQELLANPFDPYCLGEIQEDKMLAEKFKDKIKEMCQRHKNLRDGQTNLDPDSRHFWEDVVSDSGRKWDFSFRTNDLLSGNACPFDCETLFNAFADSKDCAKDNGLVSGGRISTMCGDAFFGASKS